MLPSIQNMVSPKNSSGSSVTSQGSGRRRRFGVGGRRGRRGGGPVSVDDVSLSSVSTSSNNALTDAFFNEIGFKLGAENSALGSTESPDLDGEDFLIIEEQDVDSYVSSVRESLGLEGLGQSSTFVDVEEGSGGGGKVTSSKINRHHYDDDFEEKKETTSIVSATSPRTTTDLGIITQQSQTLQQQHLEPSQSSPRAYSTPFHSYFTQALSADGKSTTDSVNSPTSGAGTAAVASSSTAQQYPQIHIKKNNSKNNGNLLTAGTEGEEDDSDVSTLGDGSYTRPGLSDTLHLKKPSSLLSAKHNNSNVPSNTNTNIDDDDDIKHTDTGSTFEEEEEVEQGTSERKDNPSIVSVGKRDSVSDFAAKQKATYKWKIIYCIIGSSILLLAGAGAALAFGIIQMKQDEESERAKNNDNLSSSTPNNYNNDDDEDWWTTSFPPPNGESGDTADADVLSQQEDLLRILAMITPSSLDSISNVTSPQYLAFSWLAGDPDYFVYTLERLIQRWVLAVFYFHFDVTTEEEVGVEDERENEFLSSWLSYTDECTWYTTDTSDICDEYGNLLALHLDGAGLIGQLPTELSLLSNSLERLYLNSNSIFGKIPPEFGYLTKLDRLQLTVNSITGTIPSSLQELTSLAVLGLGRNQIHGTLPPTLSRLSNSLTTLGLGRNQFTGQIPSEFTSLTNLAHASFANNHFSGTVPPAFGELYRLSTLSLHHNDLTGQMIAPRQFCQSLESNSSDSKLLSLTADCAEITCPCCTECCIGCVGSEGTLVPNNVQSLTSTEAPSVQGDNATTFPSTAVTENVAPSLSPSRQDYNATVFPSMGSNRSMVPSLSPSTQGNNETVFPSVALNRSMFPSESPSGLFDKLFPSFLSEVPSEAPSMTPSIQSETPSEIPSMVPTMCTPRIDTAQSCYVTNSVVQLSFEYCDTQSSDWIGIYTTADIFNIGSFEEDTLRLVKQNAVAWTQSCGSLFCSKPELKGDVQFGGNSFSRGDYIAYLVRGNRPLAATAFQIKIDPNCLF